MTTTATTAARVHKTPITTFVEVPIFPDPFSPIACSVISDSSWSDPLTYVRLLTHVLGHSGMAHLVGNMAYILLLGPALEEKYGWKNLLIVILITALITGLIHNLFFTRSILLGASGVVFAFILLTSFTDFREGEIPLTFILIAIIYLGLQIWDMITVKDNVSQLTHIIGGLVGSGAGYLLNKKKK